MNILVVGQKSTILAIVLVIFAVILTIIFVIRGISSLGGNKNNQTAKTEDRKIVAVTDIVNNPLVYQDLNVEVSAVISDWVTNRSFTFSVGGSTFGGPPKQLLIITRTPVPLPELVKDNELGLGEKVNVRVRGRAIILDRQELQNELEVDLDGTAIALDNNNINKWEEGVVILADSIEKL
ncbi:MAG: hypothetical protein AAB520_02220 [Patescibacteria group bacterium]|mgnify:FL=1